MFPYWSDRRWFKSLRQWLIRSVHCYALHDCCLCCWTVLFLCFVRPCVAALCTPKILLRHRSSEASVRVGKESRGKGGNDEINDIACYTWFFFTVKRHFMCWKCIFKARGKRVALPAWPLTNRKALLRFVFVRFFLPCGHVGSPKPGKCWARTQSQETRVRRANMHSAASLTGLHVSDWIDRWLMAAVRSPTLLQVVTYCVIGVRRDISVGTPVTPAVPRLWLPLAQVFQFQSSSYLMNANAAALCWQVEDQEDWPGLCYPSVQNMIGHKWHE